MKLNRAFSIVAGSLTLVGLAALMPAQANISQGLGRDDTLQAQSQGQPGNVGDAATDNVYPEQGNTPSPNTPNYTTPTTPNNNTPGYTTPGTPGYTTPGAPGYTTPGTPNNNTPGYTTPGTPGYTTPNPTAPYTTPNYTQPQTIQRLQNDGYRSTFGTRSPELFQRMGSDNLNETFRNYNYGSQSLSDLSQNVGDAYRDKIGPEATNLFRLEQQ